MLALWPKVLKTLRINPYCIRAAKRLTVDSRLGEDCRCQINS